MEEQYRQTPQGNGIGMAATANADLKGVMSDAEELLRAVANLSGETVAVARAKLQERLTQVRGMLSEGEQMARAKAKQAMETTDHYVHESPWQAVGIGLALGVVIGYLGHRR